MRITGGEYAGRVLAMPKGEKIRPTRTQVRQALFNILGDRVRGVRALDLFAGSGALGIESLSRGAAHATFVDRSGSCIRAIEENLRRLKVGSAAILHADSIRAIQNLADANESFDLVLLDPPYEADFARKTLSALCRCAIVSRVGWVVAEHAKREALPPEFEGPAGLLALQRIETYGDTAISFYN